MKEQERSPEKELNDMRASNLSDLEFRAIVIRMLKELRGRMNEISNNLNRDNKHEKGHRDHKKEPVRNEEYYT